MGKDRLEEHIKNEVYSHKSAVDTDDLWAGITQQKKKRRLPIFWLFFSGILLLGLGLMYSSIFSNDKTNQEILIEKITSPKDIIQPKEDSNKQLEKTKEFLTAVEPTKEKRSIESTPTNQGLNEEHISNGTESSSSNNNISKDIFNDSDNLTDQKLNTPIIIRRNGSSDDPEERKLESQRMVINSMLSIPISPSIIDITKSSKSNAQPTRPTLTSFVIPSLDLTAFAYNRAQKVLTLSDMLVENKEAVNKKGVFSIALNGNYLKGARTLSGSDSLQIVRESNETFMESWGGELVFDYQFVSGIYVGSGIAYQQINDRAILPTSVERTLDEKPFAYSIYAKEVQLIHQHRYNKIRMIDIPFNFGYQKKWNKWGAKIGGGINVNVSNTTQGRIAGLDGFVITDQADVFKKRIGYSLDGDLGITYSLLENMHLTFNPMLRYYPNSFTSSSYAIEQKYVMWGLQMGLTKTF